MNDDNLKELQNELKKMEAELKDIMQRKALLSDKKRYIERKIKESIKLQKDADAKLQGYSYQSLRKAVCENIIILGNALCHVNPKYESSLCYDHFGYMLDTNMLNEQVLNDDNDLINAIIDVCGGELIMAYRKGRAYPPDISVISTEGKHDAKTINLRKRFMEKLRHPRIKKELIRYKVKHTSY